MWKSPKSAAFAALMVAAAAPVAASEDGAPAAFDAEAFDAEAFDFAEIGREPTEEEIAGWDIDIRFDGEGLPEGSGTVAEGEDLFVMYCAACHGDFGEGAGRWPELAGGHGTLSSDNPVKTVGSYWPYVATLLDYTYRAMPYGFGQSLSPDELYAISAYILFLNDIILDEDFELSHENVMEIEMPNADGFIPDDREEVEAHFWQDEPCMENCAEGEAEIVMRAAVLDVTPDGGSGAPTLD
jgi:S-disulfanyl-L-cysteine oxidoreductase SoxD